MINILLACLPIRLATLARPLDLKMLVSMPNKLSMRTGDKPVDSPMRFEALRLQALTDGEVPAPQWMRESMADEDDRAAFSSRHYRSIWISDVHLGTRGAKAAALSEFLKFNECETLYLVGDIIDGWRMKKRPYWPQEHINVIRRVLTRAKRGTRVVYVTGNHDEFLRRYSGMSFGNIHLVDEAVHVTPGGDSYWVVHGDRFDSVVCNQRWLALLGDWGYEGLLHLNVVLNRVRSLLGLSYWSLSAYLKYKVKRAVSFIADYESTLVAECRKRGYQGVICGHIHHPEISDIDGIVYGNSGDWVESCSALVEHADGSLAVIRWSDDAQAAGQQSGEVKQEIV